MAFDIEGLYRTTYDRRRSISVSKSVGTQTVQEDPWLRRFFMRALAHQPEKPRSWVLAVAANIASAMRPGAAIRKRKHLRLMIVHEPMVAPGTLDDIVDGMDSRRTGSRGQAQALEMLAARPGSLWLLWDAGLSLS